MKYKAKNLKQTQKKKTKFSKKAKIITAAALTVCVIGGGVWYYLGHNSSEPVYVYPFQYIGMTEYWGDSQESNGPVTTDKIQTIFLSDTQTVTDIKVKEGDQVKKGDLLMSFDTSLSDLALERKRLEVEKLKLDQKQTKDRIRELDNMEPWSPPDFSGIETNPGAPIGPSGYEISGPGANDGSTPEKPLICWIKDTAYTGWSIFEELHIKAEEYQERNAAAKPASSASALLTEETPENNETPDDDNGEDTGTPVTPEEDPNTGTPVTPEGDPNTDSPVTPEGDPSTGTPGASEGDPNGGEPAAPDGDPNAGTPDNSQGDSNEGTTGGPDAEPPVPPVDDTENTENPGGGTGDDNTDVPAESTDGTEGGEDPTEETKPIDIVISDYYVVFKTTQGNTAWGATTLWQGLHVKVNDRLTYSFRFYDASGVTDNFPAPPTEEEQPPMPDIGFGLTEAQIAQRRSEEKLKLKDLDFKIKMAEAEYKIMQTEMGDGNIYADIDGSVVSLLTEEEAKKEQQPVMKVSGGGGFYVEGAVNELDKDRLQIGQEVTVNDWRSGMTYTGTVKSIGDFPRTEDSWMGMGNPNASYYPFQVFVDESADLQEGSYVSVTYSAGASQNGVYLENPFVRTEKGRSYVLVQGQDGRLEKRFVTTGKALWNSYTEILSGITPEDKIAFPYGKNIKPGVPVQEGDLSKLYDYG